jgi:hypothetical protein
MILGMGLVLVIAVVFFRKEPAAAKATPEAAPAAVKAVGSPPQAPPQKIEPPTAAPPALTQKLPPPSPLPPAPFLAPRYPQMEPG